MGAKNKLNQASVNGALVIAAIVGAITESAFLFFCTAVGLIIASVFSGEIRR